MKATQLEIEADFVPAKTMPSVITPLGTLFLSLAGHVDPAAERQRLNEQLQKVEQDLSNAAKRLENVDFITRAPPEVVEQARTRKRELQERRDKIMKLMEAMAPTPDA